MKLTNKERKLWFQKILSRRDNCKNLRAFVYNIFGVKLYSNQVKSLRDFLDPSIKKVLFSCARQGGKTMDIAIACAIIPIFYDNIHMYIFAPKQEQAQISFERFSSLVHTNPYNIYAGSLAVDKSDRIKFSNGTEIRAVTASRNAEIEGLTCHIIVLDEAQAISPFKVRECVSGNMRIPLPTGDYATMPEIIKKQLKVITPDGPERPIRYFNAGIDILHAIYLDNGKILKVNKNHKHLVYSKNWRDIKSGAVKKLRTDELKVGHRLAVADKLPYFGNEGTYDDGLIVGSFLGDGSICNDKPEFCGCPKFVSIISSVIWKKYNLKFKLKPIKSKILEGVFTNNKGGKWNSNPLTKYFRDMGMWGMKGEFKQIPNKQWSKKFLRGLIVGLIETDGCISHVKEKKGIISFGNISKELVIQLQDYLVKFGIHGTIFHKKNNKGFGKNPKPFYILSIKGIEDIRRFHKNFQLITKQKVLNEIVDNMKNKSPRISSRHYPKGIRFMQIKKIEQSETENVYCVEVKKHLWIVDGIITGNSIYPMGGAVPGGAKIIQCGVPGVRGTHFHKAFKNKYDQKINPLGYVQHIYPWDKCPILDRDYVLARKAEDPISFATQYELSWEKSNIGMFLSEEDWARCIVHYELRDKKGKPLRGEFMGIDFAKLRDSTVITELRQDPDHLEQFYVVGWWELSGVDYASQIGFIKNLWHNELKQIYADKSSVGEGPLDVLRQTGMPIEGFNFDIQHKDKLYKNLANFIQKGQIHWPASTPRGFEKEYAHFKQQMMELEKEFKLSGLISVHHNLDDSLGRDDFPDSIALAVWAATHFIEPSAYTA